MEKEFARVVVDLAVPGIGNKYFYYRVPSGIISSVQEGMRVLVPFGGRKLSGFITGFDSKAEIEVEKIKEITKILDSFPLITKELMDLAFWISEFYLCPLVEVLKAIIPDFYVKIKAKEEIWVKLKGDPGEIINHLDRLKSRAPKQALIISILLQRGEMSLKGLLEESQTGHQTVRTLESKDFIELDHKRVTREPFKQVFGVNQKLELNAEQVKALEVIKKSLSTMPKTILLHGVTGSGKTEVYLQAIEEVIKQGKEALVMVPEISLTPQMVIWFRGRFGDMVTVLHSKLSQGERYDQWIKILKGEVKIVVGPRSAVFAPFSNLGIIIIDEEHETTYKQGETPRYDAREVAGRRS
ncbi:MAG: primosomal protein N', partial [Firmicutes bacterium HGW-Firmicutes-13]